MFRGGKPHPEILCATDFSEAAPTALGQALELATRLEARRLHVLYVQEVVERIESVQALGARHDQREADLRRMVDQEIAELTQALSRPFEVPLQTRIAFGKAYREILRVAIELDADIIVVGSHGRTGFGRMVLGSVAERVVRHAPCTVVVAKSDAVTQVLRSHLLPQ